jgi:hypothetical protein
VTPLRALLMLLCRYQLSPEALILASVRERPITVLRSRRATTTQATGEPAPRVMLSRIELPVLTGWYLSDKVVPVTSLIAKAVVSSVYDVEVRTLILAASAEAIHRELYDEKTMTKAEARRIRKTAVAAVPENTRPRIQVLLRNLTDLTYVERLDRLIAMLDDSLAHGIAGSLLAVEDDSEQYPLRRRGRAVWIDSVKSARNGFAHLRRTSPEDIRQHATQTYVLYESLRWMLTAVLLQT